MSDNQEEAELNSEVANGFKEEDETYDEDVDTYYFESDHVALKGNPDYHMLLKTIILLESQRIQALKDLDKLHQCQADSLKDPIEFVKKLQSGADIGFPRRQQVATIPNLNWGKYTKNVDFSSLGLPKHMTRLKRQLVEGSPDVDQMPGNSGGSEQQVTVVRGRLKDDSKSITFNKLWNVEEQKRLEDLLIQYQPEEVEARRWQKIATALGNRTPQQVASRVQKYFIKLAKAGLPIPGRLPNLATHNKKSAHRHHRFHKFYHQQSTFLSSHEPPVYMSDDESMTADDPMYDDSNSYQPDTYTPDISDDESVPTELRESEEYKELMRLQHVRIEKLQGRNGNPPQHIGFKCDRCQCEPIIGTRWHCSDCVLEEAVDFCDMCVESNFETKKHNSSHRLKPIHVPETAALVDTDYTTFTPGDYNYLDSNYMPAN
ncbi:ZZ-type zinc finger-containing protein 3-like [Mizuhopecten yessoensis]|uniref:ZZ-type zinc finger-containing protein 3 n=1 Tax=Mizuhopecten yessoensis TaxID=6573 RepID=A0A210QV74_MIZYE|nr:ZZ-type zinc finger-containing protein 3-like [Mizuhopecten yessoensis]OWF52606.1 ZZ-type zinc finger-containing protein 3 [Mizuhopecten yessoensis]